LLAAIILNERTCATNKCFKIVHRIRGTNYLSGVPLHALSSSPSNSEAPDEIDAVRKVATDSQPLN
jgi:hypothetical protein